ncbi:hypothetical protein CLOP_g24671 [Closterium sp. NIES-67]|nr:hypothetical protein CLOP_g24671 [Closterium sp. NIES-67]
MGRSLLKQAARLTLLILLSASIANALLCPNFQCGEGLFTLGKFLDPNTPSDVFLEPSDPLVEAYFFPGQMYNYNQYNIFDEMLSDPYTDCYRFCAGYNSKLPADATIDSKAKYWMFEETCVDGNGGICACYNAYRCKDETSFTDDWMQPARGDMATDDYEVPANFTVGALCLAVEKGDPHFTGADGSHFDFSGLPNHHFALISDAHLQVNGYFGGRFGAWGNTTKALTWIRSLGIMFGHHTAVLHARNGSSADYGNGYLGHVTVNDRPVRVPAPGLSVALWPGASLRWVNARLRSGNDLVDVYDLLIADMGTLRLTLRPEVKNLRTGDDGVVHFGIDVLGATFSSAVHGVLGQTFRPDFQGRLASQDLKYNPLLRANAVPGDNAEGFIDGTVEDYLVSGLLKSDCRFCRFSRSPEMSVSRVIISRVQHGW